MEKPFNKKAILIVVISLFCTVSFARSNGQGKVGSAPSLRDDSEQTEENSSHTPNKNPTSSTAKIFKYDGDFQPHLVFLWGNSSYDYQSYPSESIVGGGVGFSNHNLFKIFAFPSLELSAGFMEDFYLLGSANPFLLIDTMLGAAIGVKFKNIVMLQAGFGINMGVLIDVVLGIGSGFDFDLKFFPDSKFSPLIGFRSGTIRGINRAETFKIYIGGCWKPVK